ncbi:MAG: RNA polymerase [Gammaproteobacteria bacterium]|nr:RNA polymerase [Gammaproteobacteria bacterium]|tara:strand:+ start:1476 stop:2048 length:573 start_codon:yes stop_codon:yes gene_type:complete
MQTDEEIMAGITAGDQRSFAEAVRMHARPIAFYAYRMLGNQSEAEDIAQETFLRLWTQASRWQPGKAALSTWLHRIAHNLCIDFLRKNKPALASELSDDLIDDQATAEETLNSEAQQNMLHVALGRLPERQRSALVLTHYQGLSNREVADMLAITVDALESLLARARRSLKTYCQAADQRPATNGGRHEQ